MASIKKYDTARGQRYEITVYAGIDEQTGRKRYVHRRGFTTQKEARLAASRLSLDADQGRLTDKGKMTFQALYEEWNAGYKNTVRESTYERTTTQIKNHLLPLLGHRRIDEITPAILQRAVNQWAKEVTRNYKRWLIQAQRILEFAVTRHYIAENPATRVTIPKARQSAGDAPENFWDRQQLAAFFSYLNPDTEPEKLALFRVLAFGGLRRGECLALTWADVSFTDNTIRVNKTLTQGMKGRLLVQPPKTPKSRRTIDMDETTMAILRRWRLKQLQVFMARGINANTPEQLLFANRFNRPIVLHQPSKWLQAIEDRDARQDKPKLAHRITVHGFRHSHASALFAAGATIKEVQERLGHEDARTTMNIYTHVTQNQNKDAADKLAKYLAF